MFIPVAGTAGTSIDSGSPSAIMATTMSAILANKHMPDRLS